jgi:hypothetical protein
LFKEHIQQKCFIGKYPHTISILYLYKQKKLGNSEKNFGFRGVIDPAETDFSDFSIEYLGEYEAIISGLPTWGIFPYKRKFGDFFGLWGIRGFIGEF